MCDLQRGTLSAVELMRNVYARIHALNPQVNALVNLLDEQEALALPPPLTAYLSPNAVKCMVAYGT